MNATDLLLAMAYDVCRDVLVYVSVVVSGILLAIAAVRAFCLWRKGEESSQIRICEKEAEVPADELPQMTGPMPTWVRNRWTSKLPTRFVNRKKRRSLKKRRP